MKYLGIDYGEKHVGVAYADAFLAEPVATLNNQRAIKQISLLISKYNIEKIIIGNCPADFFDKLKGLGINVLQVDETLSSHDARIALLHTTQTKRRKKEHSAAAAVILQSWLDLSEKKN